MRFFIILTVLTFLVSTGFWISFDQNTSISLVEVGNPYRTKPDKQGSLHELRLDLSFNKDNNTDHQADLLYELQASDGQELQSTMNTFWVSCRADKNCEQLLAEYQMMLPVTDYRLLENYPVLSAEWRQVLGDLEFNHMNTLVERVEELKNQAKLVWGNDASRILQDEYALYDFTLESHVMESSNPDLYISNFQKLIDRWEDKAQQLGLDSDNAIFEMGIDLIPEHFDFSDREYISDRIASIYLSTTQKESILLRRQQVVAQKQQIKDYNSELLQFKNELSRQRSSLPSMMTDAEWQAYYEAAIQKFRVDFFSQ